MWVGAALYEKTVICPAFCLVLVKKVPGFVPTPQVIIYVQMCLWHFDENMTKTWQILPCFVRGLYEGHFKESLGF